MTLPPIQNLLAFVRTVETGRLCLAAQALKVTESAVSHQIARLERQLGSRLLDRDRSGIALTPDGRRLFNIVAPAIQDLQNAAASITPGGRERIAVTMPQSFAALWFVPRLHKLSAALPDLECQILPCERFVDLSRERVDLAIRMGSGSWPGCLAEPFMQETVFPVCSAERLDELRSKSWEEIVRTETFIVNELHRDEWRQWCAGADLPEPVAERRTMLATFDLVANAAASGLGIAVGRSPLTAGHEKAGTLARLFDMPPVKGGSYYIVFPQSASLRGPRRRLYDWLVAEAAGVQPPLPCSRDQAASPSVLSAV